MSAFVAVRQQSGFPDLESINQALVCLGMNAFRAPAVISATSSVVEFRVSRSDKPQPESGTAQLLATRPRESVRRSHIVAIPRLGVSKLGSMLLFLMVGGASTGGLLSCTCWILGSEKPGQTHTYALTQLFMFPTKDMLFCRVREEGFFWAAVVFGLSA